jgi:hypothetical protein
MATAIERQRNRQAEWQSDGLVADDVLAESLNAGRAAAVFRRLAEGAPFTALWQELSAPCELSLSVDDVPKRHVHPHPDQDRLGVDVDMEVDRFTEGLFAKTLGDTRVVGVDLELRDANGERALFIELTLADPSGATWPYEDVLAIRRRVLDVARGIPPIEMPLYISISPETDTPQKDDENRLFDAPE